MLCHHDADSEENLVTAVSQTDDDADDEEEEDLVAWNCRFASPQLDVEFRYFIPSGGCTRRRELRC